jgi:hypothetical protein
MSKDYYAGIRLSARGASAQGTIGADSPIRPGNKMAISI